ncbi:MAG TPA: hypothetical protein VEC13_00520 [Candidatus Paceibacterota bacterium]|nr:hypothetical protein [Candidatus Paceibacterota bacterium]
MDFTETMASFLSSLPLKKMSGQEKLLAVATYLCAGETNKEVAVTEVVKKWSKVVLKTKYNASAYNRATGHSWLKPIDSKKGVFIVTVKGIKHIEDLSSPQTASAVITENSLCIFEKKSTHSFDKFLRTTLSAATTKVTIADSYVDETIFDTILDSIPKTVPMQLIYSHIPSANQTTFDSRQKRFATEYPKYAIKKYKDLHDRFLIVDDRAYIIGPSIKDAASNSPALVVALSTKDSSALDKFFHKLWVNAK